MGQFPLPLRASFSSQQLLQRRQLLVVLQLQLQHLQQQQRPRMNRLWSSWSFCCCSACLVFGYAGLSHDGRLLPLLLLVRLPLLLLVLMLMLMLLMLMLLMLMLMLMLLMLMLVLLLVLLLLVLLQVTAELSDARLVSGYAY